MKDFRFHGVTATDALRNTIEDIVQELETAAPGVEVEVKVEKESKRLGHKMFNLAMTARFHGKTLLLKRQGSEVYPLLHKMKKQLAKQLHTVKDQKLKLRRHPHNWNENFEYAS